MKVARLNERGDTLIEVLLSLAIIGLVLGLAYGTASRSSRTGQFAQEQTEALKIAETQVERIKAAITLPGQQLTANAGTEFCVNEALAKLAASETGCSSSLFTIRNTYTTSNNTFQARVDWLRQGGSGSAEAEPRVILMYKVYAP